MCLLTKSTPEVEGDSSRAAETRETLKCKDSVRKVLFLSEVSSLRLALDSTTGELSQLTSGTIDRLNEVLANQV